ncbi:succinate dehydrogenase, hydrophobic membrane anchor protein [Hahella ganghwensis]|uniref:succinate dehydrogenase, hydrophobic membrane anchor protein n=1 Tax=Hahella ganghwensis TaxID=286420 RepID=UPI000374CDA3|nr:succinate dehydrogenase, hydrophobic membrane anchor protein [Hahella ganghwensis]
MVTSVTNFGRSGAYDWMVQRVSAVVLALYTAFMVGLVLFTPDLTYEVWSSLFEKTWIRIFSLLALIALGAHAWIGLWTITTDYIKDGLMRFLSQAVCGLVMFIYLIWGVQTLWGL